MHVRTSALVGALLLNACGLSASAQRIAVRAPQGTTHGFLALEDETGRDLGYGDAVQTVKGTRVTSRLILHFNDGSLDDETTVFTQSQGFRFQSDHHIQRGPFFKEPLDLTLRASGEVTLRARDHSGQEQTETTRLTLPSDIANGMVPVLLLNTPPHTAETHLSMVLPYGKGRVITLKIQPDGQESFTAGGARRAAEIFRIHLELGGITGMVAPLLGKQPPDARLWMQGGEAPQLLRMDSQLAQDGPVVSIRLAGLTFAPVNRSAAMASSSHVSVR